MPHIHSIIGRRGWLLSACCALLAASGCDVASKVVRRTLHEKYAWNAEAYFDQPQVIALCQAIEANDLAEIDRLIQAGADVNALGKGNMTPLLWAFPDNKLERFRRLLELGADPNVPFQDDFNTRGQGMHPGQTVTHMAIKTYFPGYFDAVFEHGGSPTLVDPFFSETPLHLVIQAGGPDKLRRITLLVEKGADINALNGSGSTPVLMAVNWAQQFDVALHLLKLGADFRIRDSNDPSHAKLVHYVLWAQRTFPLWTSETADTYRELVNWLADHGESFKEAITDTKKWRPQEDLEQWSGIWHFLSPKNGGL